MATYKKVDKKGKGSKSKAVKSKPKAARKAPDPKKEAGAPIAADMAMTAVSDGNVPAYLETPDDGDIGMTPDEDDISTPLIKLVQPQGREAAQGIVKPGNYYNIRTQEDLSNTVVFIPLFRNIKRIFWEPIETGGGMICRSFDGRHGDPFGTCAECRNPETGVRRMDFAPDKTPPECTKYIEFPCLVLGDVAISDNDIVVLENPMPEEPVAVLSFARTSRGAAKVLGQVVTRHRKLIFSNVFAVSSRFVEGAATSYFVSEVEWIGWTPKAIYERIKEQLETLRAMVSSPELYSQDESNGSHHSEDISGQDTANAPQQNAGGIESELVAPGKVAEDNSDLPF